MARDDIAWLYRRVGFGLAPGELDDLETIGASAVVERLIDPDAAGVDRAPDPWPDDLPLVPDRDATRAAIGGWLDVLATSPRPLHEWMAWYWHGLFVSSIAKVKVARYMVDQIRLFRRVALGNFRDLVRDVTVDAAMLVYLDGSGSEGDSPNENYGRELMELFCLGRGTYTEPDVRAAASALTGWRVLRRRGEVRFLAGRHDDTPRTLLGRGGVHDVDTVVEAVTGHDACAPFVAGRLARTVIGPHVPDDTVAALASEFRARDLDIEALVRAVIEIGLTTERESVVSAPIPWLVAARRATAAALPENGLAAALEAAGQIPMAPPNVAGWPGGRAWLSAATTAARFSLAGALAAGTAADHPTRRSAAAGDTPRLADLLGRPGGFSDPTADAVRAAADAGGVAALTVALASPDLVLA